MTFDDFLLSWARVRLAAKTGDAGAHRTAYELLKLKRRRIQSGIAKPRPRCSVHYFSFSRKRGGVNQ